MSRGGCSFEHFSQQIDAQEVSSVLLQNADRSSKAIRQMLVAVAEPLRLRDTEVLSKTASASIGLDERDQVLLVHARCLALNGIYECFLGLDRDYGFGPACTKQAIINILRRACTSRVGRRDSATSAESMSKSDRFDQQLFDAFRSKVVSALADGGWSEQRALYEMSPYAADLGMTCEPFFPNLQVISRDRSHRYRSAIKGVWSTVWAMALARLGGPQL